MGKEDKQHDPDHLHQLKSEILEHFRALPPEHQATVALVIATELIDAGEYGEWLRQALELTRPAGGGEGEENPPIL